MATKMILPLKNYESVYSIDSHGTIINIHTNRILQPFLVRGYKRIELCKEGIRKKYFIHRLVASTFIVNPNNKPFINHIDNDRANNNIANLEWCTAKENYNHAKSQDRHTKHTLNRPDVSKKILQYSVQGDFVKEWASSMEAERAGFDSGHIIKCCMNKPKYKTHKNFIWKYKL